MSIRGRWSVGARSIQPPPGLLSSPRTTQGSRADAATLGWMTERRWRSQNAPATTRSPSIPHISLVERDLVTLQQPAEFLLKRNLPMMLLLPGDVGAHILDL
jgi:hypothetical protein